MASGDFNLIAIADNSSEAPSGNSTLDDSDILLTQAFYNETIKEIARYRRDEETLPISFFFRSESTSSHLNGDFLWFQFFIEVILRMRPRSAAMHDLITECERIYEGNNVEQLKIRQFQRDYCATDAVKWYTRDCFLYKQLNEALRQQDVHKLFIFGFYIVDLYQQLRIKHDEQMQTLSTETMTTWRGQMVAKTELERFRASLGKLISIHSFFSTTPDYLMSSGFTHAREDFISILFEIEMNTSVTDAKPFADITQLSYIPGEKEILFVLGAIFRIVSIEDYPDMCWVKLQLCSDNDIELKPVFDRLRSRVGEETSVMDFAVVLYEMGLLDKAKEIFEKLSTLCPINHQDSIRIYRFLGQIADEQGHYEQAISFFEQAMRLEDELLSPEDPERASTLNNLALVYKAMGEHSNAINYLEKALATWQNAQGEHRGNIAKCLNNLGTLFAHKQPHRALDYFEQSLTIRRQLLPANDADIAEILGNIGGVYGILGNYEQALAYAERTLTMLTDTLPSMSAKMADAYRNVGVAYANLGNYQQALHFYHKAAVILRQIMEPNHPRRLQIEEDIRRMTMKRAHASFNERFDRMISHLVSAHINTRPDMTKDNNK